MFKWRRNIMKRAMMMSNLQKTARFCRKLHTIISRETIKPSFPTPSHLQTYNLSLIDQCSHHAYIPAIFFYRKKLDTSYNKAHHLKKSLSQTLNQYYPFAGKLPTPRPNYINCNDDGVTFVEAVNDSKMEDVIAVFEQDNAVRGELFPDGLEWDNDTANNLSLLFVQLNHFACGGTAVAVSLSHKIADACTLTTFMNHWATVARNNAIGLVDNPINPHFISFPSTNIEVPLAPLHLTNDDHVAKTFIFSNSKLQELKNKVIAMAKREGTLLNNPTRVEVLSSLLYKAGMTTDGARSSSFSGPSYLFTVVNMRPRMVEEKLPETTVGNILLHVVTVITNPSEAKLHTMVAELQKSKSEVEQVRNLQNVFDSLRIVQSILETGDLENVKRNTFCVSSVIRYPLSNVDFGWGKPFDTYIPTGSVKANSFILMETCDGNGIKAEVNLERERMHIFQNDKDILAYSG